MPSSSQDLAAFPAFAAAGVRDLQAFTEASAALERITRIYDKGVRILLDAFARFSRGEDARRPGRRVLPVPRHRRHARGAQPRCPAGVRRAARPRRLRHDADPARAVRRILPAPDRPARPASRRAGGGRDQRPPHAAALRHRGEHRRHPPRPGHRAPGGLPAARHEPDRRLHRERHLPARRPARPSRSRCSPPSASTTRSSACTTTPRPRPSTSSASSC